MAKKNDALGDRMKGYENISRIYLPRRIPVIIRLDGKAFHTFTRGMQRPFDTVMTWTMQHTMEHLCENIQGCVLGYTQSDEITLVLTDYATIKSDAWFGYNIQKMTSVAASMATLGFNQFFHRAVREFHIRNTVIDRNGDLMLNTPDNQRLGRVYDIAQHRGGMFDARVFSIPKDEVCNCLIWRQQDAIRNSIEAVGQAFFSQKELDKKNSDQIQEMLWSRHNINWNNFPTENKRGSCCIKVVQSTQMEDPMNPGQQITVNRRKWVIDDEIPIFTQDRGYIEGRL